jgi:hypothetical protein
MSLVKLKGNVDKTGRLIVEIPWKIREGPVEVFINERSPEEVEAAEQAFHKMIRNTAGSCPDIERPPQGELPAPISFE